MTDTLKLIKKATASAMRNAGLTRPATLIKVVAGARTPSNLSDGTNPTETAYSARGIVSKEKHSRIGATLVEASDRVVLLLGALIAGGQVPTTKDKLTIEGATQRIVDVEVDGAEAVYLCLTRG